ncbi:hypothetical protein DL766_006330 [Monosporascus sp. MC13-8B]|uniref:Protein kinase domain-containing protein n=1 Tax=Monosporascus cannonballus TaxID=155416 RepID=A0ABY0H1K8_9PEZI|nr:hypothetical protein DL762_006592 [Monosporascus cannonballus]RYO90171.1 hypothetical protein DL763_005412 [Monosporascus cannonballus]RYP27546.1 hypothetical protein DL766_006330 [Monosporascus sp. MC13-8B]
MANNMQPAYGFPGQPQQAVFSPFRLGHNQKVVPPPIPNIPEEIAHYQEMQRMNTRLWHWRNKPGIVDENAYPNLYLMPIPWHYRGAGKSPSDFQTQGTHWNMEPLTPSDKAENLDPATSGDQLPERARRAWHRLQEVKQFFGSGGATPGFNKTWHYKKVLGYGGNGLACHYCVEDGPEKSQDAAVKVQIKGWRSSSLKREQEMMRKLTHSKHIIQEVPRDRIGKRARKRIPVDWTSLDSSDEYDSSGDEDVPLYQPSSVSGVARRCGLSLSVFFYIYSLENIFTLTTGIQPLPQKVVTRRKDLPLWVIDNKHSRWDQAPAFSAKKPSPPGEKSFIVLEFAEHGDLNNFMGKMNMQGGGMPLRIHWNWWLCLVKQCVAMTYYPRKFHPNRFNANGQDLDEIVPDASISWRKKNMVHFDFDVFNGGLTPDDGQHSIVPVLKLADFGLAEEIKPQKRDTYYLAYRRMAKWAYYSPEQFGAEWEFIPADRNGSNICGERVAGNYGSHTNVYCAALVMISVMTGCYPPQPPLRGTMTLDDGTEIVSYGSFLLDDATWGMFDFELRMILARCLAHYPDQRPSVEELLQNAVANTARANAEMDTDDDIRFWYKDQVLGAPTTPQAQSPQAGSYAGRISPSRVSTGRIFESHVSAGILGR